MNRYPTYGIIQEMLEQCVPELRGCYSEIATKFCKDIYRPYEDAVLQIMCELSSRQLFIGG